MNLTLGIFTCIFYLTFISIDLLQKIFAIYDKIQIFSNITLPLNLGKLLQNIIYVHFSNCYQISNFVCYFIHSKISLAFISYFEILFTLFTIMAFDNLLLYYRIKYIISYWKYINNLQNTNINFFIIYITIKLIHKF